MLATFRLPGIPPLFDLVHTEHPRLFDDLAAPWEILPKIGEWIAMLLAGEYKPAVHSFIPPGSHVGPDVWLGPDCIVEPGVYIKGPAWIGAGCILRNGLYVRENLVAGAGSTLGHSCELKNCFLFQKAEIPHFNYVGDCVFGTHAHIGAGVIVSNVRLDKASVRVSLPTGRVDTGLGKCGAIIGDFCEIGCNSVLNPGSVLGRKAQVLPVSSFSGVLGENCRYPAR